MHHFGRRPHLANCDVSFNYLLLPSVAPSHSSLVLTLPLVAPCVNGRPLLNSMPKNIRSMVADSLTRALNRIDAKLEANLVPPLPRIPLGGGPTTLISSAATRRDLASSMLSWRLEEEGSLLRAENPDAAGVMSLGMNAEIVSPPSNSSPLFSPPPQTIAVCLRSALPNAWFLSVVGIHIDRAGTNAPPGSGTDCRTLQNPRTPSRAPRPLQSRDCQVETRPKRNKVGR